MCGAVHERAREFELNTRVSQRVLYGLEGPDGLAELFSYLRVLNGRVEQRLGDA